MIAVITHSMALIKNVALTDPTSCIYVTNIDNPNALNPIDAGINIILYSNVSLPSENAYFAKVPPVAAQIAANKHVGSC